MKHLKASVIALLVAANSSHAAPPHMTAGADNNSLAFKSGVSEVVKINNDGTIQATNPTANSHVATKEYVDTQLATVASASTSAGGAYGNACTNYGSSNGIMCLVGNQCVYTNDVTSSTWQNCPGQPNVSNASGFFVMTSSIYNGNLGGISGANAKCLTNLQNSSWLGKGLYTLSSDNVYAFICDDTNCNSLRPNTQYKFARAGSGSVGGGSFTTDEYARGPGDTTAWSGATYFSSSSTYWSGNRESVGNESFQNYIESASSCNSWSSSDAGVTGYRANPSSTNNDRWQDRTIPCSNTLPLVCVVNPN